MDNVRWGILGTGRMAATMARELASLRSERIELTAVASRQQEKAQAFASRYGVRKACPDYASLASDPEVDVVYVATPHVLHCEDTLTCVRNGKAVLCEKPFAINAAEARAVIDAAKAADVFLMEAMWTRFLPAYAALRADLAMGAIGKVQCIVAGGGFVPEAQAAPYILNKALGGGALLDAGVYLISLASMILGTPRRIRACGILGDSGIDEQDAMVLEHPNGSMALLYISLRTRRPPDLEILGEHGRICVAAPLFNPPAFTITRQDGSVQTVRFAQTATGYGYQIGAVAAAMRAGERESAIMPLAETLSIMQTMDTIREQIGLRYAGER